MNAFLRHYATPLSLVTFAVTAITGALMFFDVRDHALSVIHEWIGMIFVIALILHLARNWIGMRAMAANPRCRNVLIGTGAVAVLLLLVAMPFGTSGGPGFGHGHGHGFHGSQIVVSRLTTSPISKVAPALGLTSDQVIARLQSGGVAVSGPEQSLAEIAAKQGTHAPRLLGLILDESDV